jgi:hypothetical protein
LFLEFFLTRKNKEYLTLHDMAAIYDGAICKRMRPSGISDRKRA